MLPGGGPSGARLWDSNPDCHIVAGWLQASDLASLNLSCPSESGENNSPHFLRVAREEGVKMPTELRGHG